MNEPMCRARVCEPHLTWSIATLDWFTLSQTRTPRKVASDRRYGTAVVVVAPPLTRAWPRPIFFRLRRPALSPLPLLPRRRRGAPMLLLRAAH